MSQPENSAAEQRGKPFKPGQSGNPSGKPKGARHRATVFAEKLMEDETGDVVRAVINAAKGGDMVAARLVLERIAPPRKGRTVRFELPPIEKASDVLTGLSALIQAVSIENLTPDEATTVASLIELKRRAIETLEIERRLVALEAAPNDSRR
jgi:hypothetical protein